MIRVLVIDDHAIVRDGIRSLLERNPGVQVVGEAATGRAALEAAASLRPDVALVDLTLPDLDGIEVLARLGRCSPSTRAVVLSMHGEPEYVRSAEAAGAKGYVVKGSGIDELLPAIEAVARGETFLDAHAKQALRVDSNRPEPMEPGSDQLTARERDVLRLVASGSTNRQAADRLGIALKTVDAHRTSAMRKLNAHNASDLTRAALRLGLLPP